MPTIVVTGGTKGIGRAIIEKFWNEGWEIITCSRTKKTLEELSQALNNERIKTYVADLSKKEERNDFCSRLPNENIDILVNNTGMYIPGMIHEEEEGVLSQMIETNLYSAYEVSRAIIPQFKKKRQGHIFTICSTASIMPYVNGGSYCISKFALYGMNKVIREEMKAYNVKVTSILPGVTKTSSWEGVDLEEGKYMIPSDVAETIWSCNNMASKTVIEEIIMRPQLGDL